jgi:hypothetical protein
MREENRVSHELSTVSQENKRHFFSNRSIKTFDESLVVGLVLSSLLWLFSTTKFSSTLFCYIFLGTTIFTLVLYNLFFAKTIKKNFQYVEKKFETTIKDLTLAMYRNGLVLSYCGSDVYVFKTNNKVLPNYHFIVKDCIEYCSILGQCDSLERLDNQFFQIEK